MSWKNWPSWLKGWIIALIIIVLFAFVAVNVGILWGKQSWIIGLTLQEILFYALVGALIGWIYGKIKPRGKKK